MGERGTYIKSPHAIGSLSQPVIGAYFILITVELIVLVRQYVTNPSFTDFGTYHHQL